MPKVHSHYENLKVARDAPPEVIRAAYRSLSQMYHPDRNPGDPDATRIMAILNVAFETLSDPDKRRRHNQWIAEQEAIGAKSEQKRGDTRRNKAFTVDDEEPHQATESSSNASGVRQDSACEVDDPKISILQNARYIFLQVPFDWAAYGAVAVFIVLAGIVNFNATTSTERSAAPSESTPTRVSPNSRFFKPRTAPNGEPWPITSGYITGYRRLNSTGLSTVTVDNSQNDSDVFVKLFSLSGHSAMPVRVFYIYGGSEFTLTQVTAGIYDIRYQDLETGRFSRSEAFTLEENQTYRGTQYSNITMTLYKVQNGNMRTYSMTENEF